MRTDLESVLARKSERLIVTAINEGFFEMYCSWLDSVKRIDLG